ncbi:hypothetical protein KR222_009761, partial [Zaprionus bogoriensis]
TTMEGGVDLNLLKYNTYTDYLSSFMKAEDYRYFGNMGSIRKLVKLGYRSTRMYSEDEYKAMIEKIAEMINPKVTSSILYGNYFYGDDEALEALAEREEANLLSRISTIIFLQIRQRSGFDISGYIDFEKSLRDCMQKRPEHTNWKAVFEGRVLLKPKPTDLSYFDWHRGIVLHTDTDSWQSVVGSRSLVFMHKADHKLVPVTDKKNKFSVNVKRSLIQSKLYGFMILYDHVIR